MKTLANLMLTALFVLVAAQAQSILAQGTLERSILGSVVEQQENKDTGDRTVVVEVKLDTTVDGVELKLPDQVVEGAKTIALNNWTLVKGKGLIT
ncbi:MAG TPA: hypothetical protein VJT71_20420, partial [Pyrinomonadaceae bacterium]|nr:hypothetical protein [Pyrinomonadaceae bacterium]